MCCKEEICVAAVHVAFDITITCSWYKMNTGDECSTRSVEVRHGIEQNHGMDQNVVRDSERSQTCQGGHLCDGAENVKSAPTPSSRHDDRDRKLKEKPTFTEVANDRPDLKHAATGC